MTDTLPHDAAAERAVLGACMEAPESYRIVRAIMSRRDFFEPRHQLIWDAIEWLVGIGAAPDVLLVFDRLRELGQIVKLDRPAYLHDVIEHAPIPVQVDRYAQIVADVATRRRVIQAAQHAIQLAEQGIGEASELVESAMDALRGARDERAGVELLTSTVDEFMHSVPDAVDWVVPGLLGRGDRLVLTGSGGLGKALAVSTPVATVRGWSTMGELRAGDDVFGPDGQPTRVVAATSLMLNRPCYEVTFSDGASIVADEQHLWLTETTAARAARARAGARPVGPLKVRGTDQKHKRNHYPAVITTLAMRETIRNKRGEINHAVEVCQPLNFPDRNLLIPPYVLGAWLGDGHSAGARITSADPEIVAEIQTEGIPCRHLGGYSYSLSDGIRRGRYQGPLDTLVGRLRVLGVLNGKHIPSDYLSASPVQRLALLQGLMDTDGTIWAQQKGSRVEQSICEFSVTSERLARNFHTLLSTFGIKASFKTGRAVLDGREIGSRYRISFQTDLPVFRLPRKLARMLPTTAGRRTSLRYVVSVEPVQSVPVRCIQVERPDGMFVAGTECIPTHNSTLLRQIAVCAAAGIDPLDWQHGEAFDPVKVAIVDCENADHQLKTALWPMIKEAKIAGQPVEDRLTVGGHGNPLNLLDASSALSLLRTIDHDKPDLVYIGPAYKLHNDDPDKETVVKRITHVLDQIRQTGSAVMTEAHHTKGAKLGGSLEPSGSNLWTWWPEFGRGLRLVADSDVTTRMCHLEPWRIDRVKRDWPNTICSGGRWPWARATDNPYYRQETK
jgi:replicative DNA helicase